jgi:hypothetical protein
VALDHRHRRAHDPPELEHGHAGRQRVRGLERLPERLHDVVAPALRQPGPPGRDLAGHALQIGERRVAERGERVSQALAQRLDRPRPHRCGVEQLLG